MRTMRMLRLALRLYVAGYFAVVVVNGQLDSLPVVVDRHRPLFDHYVYAEVKSKSKKKSMKKLQYPGYSGFYKGGGYRRPPPMPVPAPVLPPVPHPVPAPVPYTPSPTLCQENHYPSYEDTHYHYEEEDEIYYPGFYYDSKYVSTGKGKGYPSSYWSSSSKSKKKGKSKKTSKSKTKKKKKKGYYIFYDPKSKKSSKKSSPKPRTQFPTCAPPTTRNPTRLPTRLPTRPPNPIVVPTAPPVPITSPPTSPPTSGPTFPPGVPTPPPFFAPTLTPVTAQPTLVPETSPPSIAPVTAPPTLVPDTTPPSIAPVTAPPTIAPTTAQPTFSPTRLPSPFPTLAPVDFPVALPTSTPTVSPTSRPTSLPTPPPTDPPVETQAPTRSPTRSPTAFPTREPIETDAPTANVAVDASPFFVLYDFFGNDPALSDSNFQQAAAVTANYVNDYMIAFFDFAEDTNLENVQTRINDFFTDPVRIGFDVNYRFGEDSVRLPSQESLDNLLIQAFQQPNVQALLFALRGLPQTNPFSTATDASYTSEDGTVFLEAGISGMGVAAIAAGCLLAASAVALYLTNRAKRNGLQFLDGSESDNEAPKIVPVSVDEDTMSDCTSSVAPPTVSSHRHSPTLKKIDEVDEAAFTSIKAGRRKTRGYGMIPEHQGDEEEAGSFSNNSCVSKR